MKKTTPEQWKDTGLALVLILLLLTATTEDIFYVVPAIVCTLFTMTWPKFFYPLSILWFGLAHLMGVVASRVVLCIIYFLIVLPIGLLRRTGKNDPMGFKKWKSGQGSVFVSREHLFSAEDMDKPF